MKRDYFISVAMATYNGEKYIKEQLESILLQLENQDEVIVSDDGSTDHTLKIIESLNDQRIKILKGPRNGVKQNFAHALSFCKGKYIFLSDQDDIWLENKVKHVLTCFEEKKCDCITHNCDVVNSNHSEVLIESFFDYRKSTPGILSNIYKNKYLGCCMAFKNEMLKSILPIPNSIEMHDQWIGLICEKFGTSIFLDKKLIHYRRHDDNVSQMKHYPLLKMIKNRVVLIQQFIKRR